MPRGFIRKLQSRLLIWLYVPFPTPCRKRSRTNPSPGDDKASGLQLPFKTLGVFQPRIESVRQLVRVAEDRQQGGIIVAVIPRQANDLRWRCHGSRTHENEPAWPLHMSCVDGKTQT